MATTASHQGVAKDLSAIGYLTVEPGSNGSLRKSIAPRFCITWVPSKSCLNLIFTKSVTHSDWEGACMPSCNLPAALLAQWQGSFMCYCSNSNAGGTYTKVRVESALRLLTLLTKVLLPLLLRIMPHHKFDALSLSYIHTPDGTLRKVGTVTVGRGEGVSKLVFYAESTGVVISGQWGGGNCKKRCKTQA